MPKEKKSTDSCDEGVVQLKDISAWSEDMKKIHLKEKLEGKEHNEYSPVKEDAGEEHEEVSAQKDSKLNDAVSLYRGDITKLKVDAVVNAANKSLLGGGGVDGCIHRAAGPKLLSACRQLNGCNTGEAKITLGYDLPAKHVIHTVGPIARGNCDERLKRQLRNCYENSLMLLETQGLRSIAFPCISTGIYGFPQEDAAEIAVSTIKEWLADKRSLVDRIIFCVFLESDLKIYKEKMLHLFPTDDEDLNANSPSSKKYGNKELVEKNDDKIEGMRYLLKQVINGLYLNLQLLRIDFPLRCPESAARWRSTPLVSHDDESKLQDVYMDSQLEDKQQEDNVMLSQPCTQIEEIEMGNSQEQTEEEDKDNTDRIPYIDECEEESGQ
ncbi:ADP-ribose glycohydrolase MACROD2 [Leucoraja erinacea]|uniref:ADP-ribose glycohydrolase MACROD2 n=1 Tax=Leucoraja erinaceus TaxID=7782 RepID=UPI0024543231|nr:ADP-ribose glycohydrolase MACROD2 [Leucoraja erinacea]